jgi:hypothetical protein
MDNPDPDPDDAREIADAAELDALYARPSDAARAKEIDRLSDEYRAFIEAAPFVLIASNGPRGLDVSPRGDPPGFAHVLDANRIDLPDRPGNNRLDTLRNVLHDPRVALLFLVPGAGETIRVQGRARLLLSPTLAARYAVAGRPARSVLRVEVERAYFQCPKALVRSRLWDPEARIDRATLPTAGDMLAAITGGRIGGASFDAEYPERMRRTIY